MQPQLCWRLDAQLQHGSVCAGVCVCVSVLRVWYEQNTVLVQGCAHHRLLLRSSRFAPFNFKMCRSNRSERVKALALVQHMRAFAAAAANCSCIRLLSCLA